MPQSNEKMLRDSYEAFGLGDLKPLMDSLSDDIQWRVSGNSPLAGSYTGKDAVLGLFGKMMELYKGTLRVQVVDILAKNGRGLVMTKEQATYQGQTVEFSCVHVWTARDGKLAEFDVFYDDAYHQFWRQG